jgi:hypothetical protein
MPESSKGDFDFGRRRRRSCWIRMANQSIERVGYASA